MPLHQELLDAFGRFNETPRKPKQDGIGTEAVLRAYQHHIFTEVDTLIEAHLQSSEDKVLEAFEAFLATNWQAIRGTMLCYTAIPNDPSTQFLCEMAMILAVYKANTLKDELENLENKKNAAQERLKEKRAIENEAKEAATEQAKKDELENLENKKNAAQERLKEKRAIENEAKEAVTEQAKGKIEESLEETTEEEKQRAAELVAAKIAHAVQQQTKVERRATIEAEEALENVTAELESVTQSAYAIKLLMPDVVLYTPLDSEGNENPEYPPLHKKTLSWVLNCHVVGTVEDAKTHLLPVKLILDYYEARETNIANKNPQVINPYYDPEGNLFYLSDSEITRMKTHSRDMQRLGEEFDLYRLSILKNEPIYEHLRSLCNALKNNGAHGGTGLQNNADVGAHYALIAFINYYLSFKEEKKNKIPSDLKEWIEEKVALVSSQADQAKAKKALKTEQARNTVLCVGAWAEQLGNYLDNHKNRLQSIYKDNPGQEVQTAQEEAKSAFVREWESLSDKFKNGYLRGDLVGDAYAGGSDSLPLQEKLLTYLNIRVILAQDGLHNFFSLPSEDIKNLLAKTEGLKERLTQAIGTVFALVQISYDESQATLRAFLPDIIEPLLRLPPSDADQGLVALGLRLYMLFLKWNPSHFEVLLESVLGVIERYTLHKFLAWFFSDEGIYINGGRDKLVSLGGRRKKMADFFIKCFVKDSGDLQNLFNIIFVELNVNYSWVSNKWLKDNYLSLFKAIPGSTVDLLLDLFGYMENNGQRNFITEDTINDTIKWVLDQKETSFKCFSLFLLHLPGDKIKELLAYDDYYFVRQEADQQSIERLYLVLVLRVEDTAFAHDVYNSLSDASKDILLDFDCTLANDYISPDSFFVNKNPEIFKLFYKHTLESVKTIEALDDKVFVPFRNHFNRYFKYCLHWCELLKIQEKMFDFFANKAELIGSVKTLKQLEIVVCNFPESMISECFRIWQQNVLNEQSSNSDAYNGYAEKLKLEQSFFNSLSGEQLAFIFARFSQQIVRNVSDPQQFDCLFRNLVDKTKDSSLVSYIITALKDKLIVLTCEMSYYDDNRLCFIFRDQEDCLAQNDKISCFSLLCEYLKERILFYMKDCLKNQYSVRNAVSSFFQKKEENTDHDWFNFNPNEPAISFVKRFYKHVYDYPNGKVATTLKDVIFKVKNTVSVEDQPEVKDESSVEAQSDDVALPIHSSSACRK